jgi:hypothetical protein
MDRVFSANGEKRDAYRVLVGKPEGKRPLRRPRRRWVDNIKINLREIVWDDMDYLAEDRDQWKALVPPKHQSGSTGYPLLDAW